MSSYVQSMRSHHTASGSHFVLLLLFLSNSVSSLRFISSATNKFIQGHVELIASLHMYTPFGISRDVTVHAYGANCLQDKGSIVIVTHSVSEFPGVDIPPNSTGFFNDVCEVKYMYAVTTLLSPSSAKVHYTSTHITLTLLIIPTLYSSLACLRLTPSFVCISPSRTGSSSSSQEWSFLCSESRPNM